MKTVKRNHTRVNRSMMRTLMSLLLVITMTVFSSQQVFAHCDRENGPVAKAAVEALETGEFDKISIWVGEEQEKELKEKFNQSLKVYRQGGESKQLAKKYFMETSIRLHREAEGMPFTGLKEASPNPKDIALAEEALETGNLQPVLKMFNEELEKEATKWFQKAREARANKNESVAAGREWVDLYVKYIIYVHKLYKKIQAGPPHGVGE